MGLFSQGAIVGGAALAGLGATMPANSASNLTSGLVPAGSENLVTVAGLGIMSLGIASEITNAGTTILGK